MSETHPAPLHYDAIVVGARAAGAATAMLLARQGFRVLVVERGRRGADTLSTLALMRSGVMQLHRWGLLDAVREAGTPPIRRTLFHYADETVAVDIKPAFGVGALYAPRRTILDPILIEGARNAGARFRFRVTVEDLLRDTSGRVIGITGHTEGRQTFEARGRIVIGADGTKSVVAGAAGARTTRTVPSSSGIIYGFFRGVGTDAYEWVFNAGLAAGIIPTNDEASCIFVSGPTERLRSEVGTDLESRFLQILRQVDSETARRVSAGESAERLRGFGGIDSYFRTSSGPGWALVGDAGYFKDPITAHGISDALRDAELLARAVKTALDHPSQEATALGQYEATRDHLSEDLFEATERIARYDWSTQEIQELHHQLSRSMKAENELLSGLDEPDPAGSESAVDGSVASRKTDSQATAPPR